jgi:hypothetical protein
MAQAIITSNLRRLVALSIGFYLLRIVQPSRLGKPCNPCMKRLSCVECDWTAEDARESRAGALKVPFRPLLWDRAAGAGGIARPARSRSRLGRECESDIRVNYLCTKLRFP